VLQHLGESAAPELLPANGTLLHLPQPPILTLSLRTFEEGSALLTLFNASDEMQSTTVTSGLVKFNTANRCDLFGNPLETLPVKNGALEISIAPRRTLTLAIR
jgi:hypothetical protein